VVEAEVDLEVDVLAVELRIALHLQSQLHPVIQLDSLVCLSIKVPEYLASAVDERTTLSSKLGSASMRLLVCWLLLEGRTWYGMAKVWMEKSVLVSCWRPGRAAF